MTKENGTKKQAVDIDYIITGSKNNTEQLKIYKLNLISFIVFNIILVTGIF